MAEHPRKKTPPTIGVTSTETSQVSSHKATAVWPVCDPMPKARTGSKPSKRMTPMKSPLWICDSFRMGWSPGGETRFLCAKTKMLLEEALKGARAGNQSESVGFRALWLFLCILYIYYIYTISMLKNSSTIQDQLLHLNAHVLFQEVHIPPGCQWCNTSLRPKWTASLSCSDYDKKIAPRHGSPIHFASWTMPIRILEFQMFQESQPGISCPFPQVQEAQSQQAWTLDTFTSKTIRAYVSQISLWVK